MEGSKKKKPRPLKVLYWHNLLVAFLICYILTSSLALELNIREWEPHYKMACFMGFIANIMFFAIFNNHKIILKKEEENIKNASGGHP